MGTTRPAARRNKIDSKEEVYSRLRRFLQSCRRPALLEPGEEILPLGEDSYVLSLQGDRLFFQAWSDRRNLVRKIQQIKEESPNKVELVTEKFGKRPGVMFLVDLDSPHAEHLERRGSRLAFRDRFRRFLCRQFPDWRIEGLTTEPDLEHSLSPVYPRALLRRGSSGWAVLGAGPEPDTAHGALTFGLIWLDHLRRRELRLTVEGLALFLPQGEERPTSLRLPYLDMWKGRFGIYVYSPDDCVDRLDPRDYGNLETALETCRRPVTEINPNLRDWVAHLTAHPEVEEVMRNDGEVSLRLRGLEFARTERGVLLAGLERKRPVPADGLATIEGLAEGIARMRSPDAADRDNPLYRAHAELWLESCVRRSVQVLDAQLLPFPIYGQVPAFAGGDRGIIDLLAADRNGRLAVVELKAREDPHLPLQALDYWMRVKWHLDRDEFAGRGYFPGIQIRRDPPRLLLVAPSLDFHPTTETILRFFSPLVPAERIGLGLEWRKETRVAFRLSGSEIPH